MSTRIYVDANIYLDYFGERTDGIRPLGEFAFKIFTKTLECEFEIVVSNIVMNEINKHCRTSSRFDVLFEELMKKQKIIRTNATIEDEKQSKKYKECNDMLHYLLAEKTGCKFIVTRNIQHFSDFPGLVKPKLPEQL